MIRLPSAGRVVPTRAVLAVAALVLAGCTDGAEQTKEGPEPAPPGPARSEPERRPPQTDEPAGPARRPVVAGRFYPADPDELRRKVRGYIDAAEKVELPGRLLAVIGPHAGYVFSGPVAGWAHRQLVGLDVETVVLVGGHGAFEHAAVMTSGAYLTPLGRARIDSTLARSMVDASVALRDDFRTHAGADHALEVHVPFIQVALPKARIVPVYFNREDIELAARVGEGIARAIRGKKAVIVTSTDLSHYPPARTAEKADRAILGAVVSLDPERIMKENDRLLAQHGREGEQCTLCGLGAVLATVEAAKRLGATGAKVLRYDHSGNRAYKDRSRVVGYGAVAIYGAGPHQQRRAQTAGGMKMAESPAGRNPAQRSGSSGGERLLSDEERKVLLTLARRSVETSFEGGGVPRPEPMTPAIETKTGAFVTLRKHGELRGCIGTFERSRSLWKVVGEFARNAAFEDTRFAPVKKDELDEIKFEISVLSPLKKIDNPLDVRLGTDGIWLVGSGGERGTFLPQVATETGWSKEKFLSYCASHKAGMPPDAWRDPERCTVYTYTAEVFSEGEH